jgi:hypothetical protein
VSSFGFSVGASVECEQSTFYQKLKEARREAQTGQSQSFKRVWAQARRCASTDPQIEKIWCVNCAHTALSQSNAKYLEASFSECQFGTRLVSF